MGRVETGEVYEQPVGLEAAAGRVWALRRLELHLDEPTEEGDTVICLLTNLPAALRADELAPLYRRRWRIETLFQRLERVLHSETRSLGQPRAALLGFGVAALAYNVLSVLSAAIRCQHKLTATTLELSLYYLALEIHLHTPGMHIAVPARCW